MHRNESQLAYQHRPASRRLHRRSAHPGVTSCVLRSRVAEHSPVVVGGLPKAIIREAGMFELLAAELRIAELEKALAEAHEAACTDPLTGALNRRGFEQVCQRELALARRSGCRFALALLDIDDFKRLNDRYGHQAGDVALVHLVDLLRQSMRPSDVLCRFGGEEFVLMLPATTLDEASKAVARVLREFSAQALPGTDCVMTFSAGVVVHGFAESLDQAIGRADQANYAAKRSGKNRIVTG
ncbi:MAG: GGDEF domain-containing protein [Propionivibrio sp.]|uniref:GGDEF domain-containing protein n=2 Tax=Propionivibrio sp. TaxID=2212460 RepID=UPI0025F0C6B3|nr:GGDEF domain-containing protein [Propionivibrio sp.]MBK8894450.1 GGDEF domain-containing protein [Propionivibrio sp.]